MPTIRVIQNTVASAFGITSRQMLSRSRKKILSEARALSIYLCRVHTGRSFLAIARAHDRANHTTAISAVQRHYQLSRSPDYLRKQTAVVKQLFHSSP
jgi:chromosomal replication initiator protein